MTTPAIQNFYNLFYIAVTIKTIGKNYEKLAF
jgi:hypothetical protein